MGWAKLTPLMIFNSILNMKNRKYVIIYVDVKVSIWPLAHRPTLVHSSLSLLLGGPQMKGPNKALGPKAPSPVG